MVEIKEINLSSIAQPAHAKIMRGSGGRYDYELSYHGETMKDTLDVLTAARNRLERELAPYQPCAAEIAKKEQA